jgi:hypothetical protein
MAPGRWWSAWRRLTLATAVAGTLGAILATVRLSPAAAMRPPAPGHYRRTLAERFVALPGVRRVLRLSAAAHDPAQHGAPALAHHAVHRRRGAAVAIVILGNFFRDAIEVIVDTSSTLQMRTTWRCGCRAGGRPRALRTGAPGRRACGGIDPLRAGDARQRHRRERSQIRGAPAVPELYRMVDVQQRVHTLAPGWCSPTAWPTSWACAWAGAGAEVLEGRPRTCRADGGRHRARDDGPERLHGPRGAEPRAGRRRPRQRLRAALDPDAGAGLLRATRRMPRVAGSLQQGQHAAQHGGDQRPQRAHHEHGADAVRLRDRGGCGLQQRPHRAGRARLGAGQPAGAGFHACRGVGAAAGRTGAGHPDRWRCRWACCWAGRWCMGLVGADEERPVPFRW